MSDQTHDINPYAPPSPATEANPHGDRPRSGTKPVRRDLREALARLHQHLSEPDAVEHDRVTAGRRFRVFTVVCCAFVVVALALLAVGASDTRQPTFWIGLVLGAVAGLLAALLVSMDLSLIERGKPSSPEAALKSFLKSIPMNRAGYAWAALCPTAREQRVSPPSLGPVVTGAGEFSLDDPAGWKAYTATFARPGQSQMRTMAVKRVTPRGIDGDVAEVDVVLAFQSWPQWVSIVMGVSFAIFRLLILIGVVFYFVLRKRHEVTVTKTMLRGQNGAWYVFDGDLLEGAGGA